MNRINTSTLGSPGSIDHLGYITTDSAKNIGKFYINGDNLVGDFDTNTDLLCRSSEFRAISCSELKTALTNKFFLRMGLVVIEEPELDKDNPEAPKKIQRLFFQKKLASTGEDIPKIVKLSNDKSMRGNGIPLFPKTLSTEEQVYIDSMMASLYGSVIESKSVYNDREVISSTENNKDLAFTSSTFTLISPDSDIYTDAINLNTFIHHSVTPFLTGKTDVDIRYSKLVNGQVMEFSDSICFNSFFYDKNCNLEVKDFIQEIQDDIQVEYFGGVLRVFPKKSTISECIINSCFLTYAKC